MIYLDHAATSYPKPDVVLDAVTKWFRYVGVSPDRGDGPRTRSCAETVQRARRAIAERTGHRADRVAFCSGATEGLNLALRALATPGSHVLTTYYEHSSVVRPLTAMTVARDLRVTRSRSTEDMCRRLAEGEGDLVVMTHASNVTGALLDADSVADAARARGVPMILDASQTAGYVPLKCGAAVVVASAHKALHAPPGLGFVSVSEDVELAPQKFGGTGSSAALERHPSTWPQAFEAGTPNTPAVYGLAAAFEWIEAQGERALLNAARAPMQHLIQELQGMPDVRLFHGGESHDLPVLSFTHQRFDPAEIGAILAGEEIHCRGGFHCAPWVHDLLGTTAGGTLRVSTGPATTASDIDQLVAVLRAL